MSVLLLQILTNVRPALVSTAHVRTLSLATSVTVPAAGLARTATAVSSM